MLESYFCAPKTLRRLRAGLSGPYIDGFADALERDGYAHASAVCYLRAAAHFGIASCIAKAACWRTWTLALWTLLAVTFHVADVLGQTVDRLATTRGSG